jgi:hypothetical protein
MIVITGQQKIRLNKWEKGLLKDTDLYKLLASRINQIPLDMSQNKSDKECIQYLIDNSKVDTDIHNTINWWYRYSQTYKKQRYQHYSYKNK